MEEYRAKIRMAEDIVSQNQAALRAETINKRKNEELFDYFTLSEPPILLSGTDDSRQ